MDATISPTIAGYLTGTWTIDPTHTSIGFTVRHLMVAKVRGSFGDYSGTITTAADALDSSAELTVDLASIDTRNPDRDNHLRSSDFFDAESHPKMTYRTTAVRTAGDDYLVDGELTIKEVTRPVSLTVELLGIHGDPWGGTRIGLSARGEIDRRDFGINFNIPLEGGGVVIGDRIQLDIEVEAVLDA